MKTTTIILLGLLFIVLDYLIMSFILWDLNISTWGIGSRFFIGLLIFLQGVAITKED